MNRKTETICLALVGETREVDAVVVGAWAAHVDVNYRGYRVTLIRFGVGVPFVFETEDQAVNAAKALDAVEVDWPAQTLADIKAMGKRLSAICEDCGGELGAGPRAPLDHTPVAGVR